MKVEITPQLQIFVTQKKTNAIDKAYYITYRNGGVSKYKKYTTNENLLADLNGLDLIAGTWEIPNIGAPVLFNGETSIPDDEEIKTIFSYKAIISSSLLDGTQSVVLVMQNGAGVGSEEFVFFTLAGSESIKNFTDQLF